MAQRSGRAGSRSRLDFGERLARYIARLNRCRPLVQEADNLQAKLEQLRDERLGLYEGLADIRVDTDNNHFTNSFKKLLHDVENRLRREK